MHILFANTGVQIVCVPVPSTRRFTTAQIGYGWQYCHLLRRDPESGEDQVVGFPYIQWQIIQSRASRLFFAVDTSLGDPEIGYFCDASALGGDFLVSVEGLLDVAGQPLPGLPKVELCLRAATATAGEAKPVHLVIDFGNSRTGALLVEMQGEVTQSAAMMPVELNNRYNLDAWNEAGEPVSRPSSRWFSSRTTWCNSPYLLPAAMLKKEYYRETVKRLLGSKQVTRERETEVRPQLFLDWSLARLGREADDVGQAMHAQGDFRTQLSSPKRYLWADDDSWLEGAFWYMPDPHDRLETGAFGGKLQGNLLRYLPEDDRDVLLAEPIDPQASFASQMPVKPRHAPRTMMVVALYELLCQAYEYVNSIAYRGLSGDPSRSREIRSLTMTYPSGMFQEERERFAAQAQKAINLFSLTLGKHQRHRLDLTFSIDEASAVHLTYIWSELRMLGQDPRLWFSALSRDHSLEPAAAPDQASSAGDGRSEDWQGAMPAGRRRNRQNILRRGGPGGQAPAEAAAGNQALSQRELRIACIDMGGGTTNLMIAGYTFRPGIDDSIEGQVLHQDGVSIAGDQLIKRLLEKIVVPTFADSLGLEEEDVQLLFGPEVPKNRGWSGLRINWMNRLFVPLAEAYLQAAVDETNDVAISHTDPGLVEPAVIESLEQACNRLRGPGYYNLRQELPLVYDSAQFREVVREVFADLLFDFCTRIVEHQADVILLAGQPTKLSHLQDLIRQYVPLPASRIIPMFNHYAGNWYPYQDSKGRAPGVIVDPKSAVVVGAAIEFMARNGMLPQFKFSMHGREHANSYFWGVMTDATSSIRPERILFRPASDHLRDESTEFTTITQRMVIGRKMQEDEVAQATPIYVLKMNPRGRLGGIEVTVRVRRVAATAEREEHLELESVAGTIAGEPAVLGDNVEFKWRTLADERYYLDTGGLDNIEFSDQQPRPPR
jgi:hypothetical protein